MMARIEVALTFQATAISTINRRIDEGDANIEQRFTCFEKKMADALAAMGSALQQLANSQQKAEANLQATISQAAAAAQVAAAAQGANPCEQQWPQQRSCGDCRCRCGHRSADDRQDADSTRHGARPMIRLCPDVRDCWQWWPQWPPAAHDATMDVRAGDH